MNVIAILVSLKLSDFPQRIKAKHFHQKIAAIATLQR